MFNDDQKGEITASAAINRSQDIERRMSEVLAKRRRLEEEKMAVTNKYAELDEKERAAPKGKQRSDAAVKKSRFKTKEVRIADLELDNNDKDIKILKLEKAVIELQSGKDAEILDLKREITVRDAIIGNRQTPNSRPLTADVEEDVDAAVQRLSAEILALKDEKESIIKQQRAHFDEMEGYIAEINEAIKFVEARKSAYEVQLMDYPNVIPGANAADGSVQIEETGNGQSIADSIDLDAQVGLNDGEYDSFLGDNEYEHDPFLSSSLPPETPPFPCFDSYLDN